jgi:hypothetical protein
MILRTSEYPFVEAKKCPGNCGDSNLAKNLSNSILCLPIRYRLERAFAENGFIGIFSISEVCGAVLKTDPPEI